MVHFIVEATSPKHQSSHQPTLQNHAAETLSLRDRMDHAAQGIQKVWRRRKQQNQRSGVDVDTRADILLPILIGYH